MYWGGNKYQYIAIVFYQYQYWYEKRLFTNTNSIAMYCNYNWSNIFIPIPIVLQCIAIIMGPLALLTGGLRPFYEFFFIGGLRPFFFLKTIFLCNSSNILYNVLHVLVLVQLIVKCISQYNTSN